MFPYIVLMRPLNSLMAILAVVCGGVIVAGTSLALGPLLLAVLAAFLITGAGNAINDYADVEADKINRPKRPIPSGKVSSRHALAFTVALFLVGILLTGFLNSVAFIIAVVNALLLVGYSLWFQNKLLVGNVVVSYLVGSTFLFGGAALATSVSGLLIAGLLTLLAFFANLSREIVKDMEDVEGDRASFLKRMKAKAKASLGGERFSVSSVEPSIKHKRSLIALAQASLLLAILVSPAPYLLGYLGMSYLILVIATDIMLFLAFSLLFTSLRKSGIREKTAAVLFGKKFYRDVSRYIKTGMLLGLLAFLAGALF